MYLHTKLLNVDTLYPFFSSSFSWIQLILTIRSRRILVAYLWPPLLPDPFMSVSWLLAGAGGGFMLAGNYEDYFATLASPRHPLPCSAHE